MQSKTRNITAKSLSVFIAIILISSVAIPIFGYAKPALAQTTPTWSNLTPSTSPSQRMLPSMVYDKADGYLLLFGGYGCGGVCGDTWKFSNGAWTQLAVSNSPSPRAGASIVYDAADGYVLLFGGSNVNGEQYGSALGDTWKFSNGVWTRLSTPSGLDARVEASIAYDASDGYVLLFGGWNGQNIFGDAWKFNGGTWTPLTATPPHSRVGGGMVYDESQGYVLLFGGTANPYSSADGLADTWKYQGGAWTQLLPATAPGDRNSFGFTYDNSIGKPILFAGWNPAGGCGADVDDTWEFNGINWIQLNPTTSPSGRQSEGLVYDPQIQEDVMFGGVVNSGADYVGCGTPILQGDTWTFGSGSSSPDATIISVSSPNTVSTSGQTTVTATVTDTTTNTNPTGTVTFNDGTPSAGGIFGSISCSPSGNNQLVCTATYTAPKTVGSVNITANYPANSNFAASSNSATLDVIEPLGFQLQVSPSSQIVGLTGNATFNVSIISQNGFTTPSSVKLSISTIVPGISCRFGTNTPSSTCTTMINPEQTTSLTFYTSPTANEGLDLYTITATGSFGSETTVESQTVQLTVKKIIGVQNLITLSNINIDSSDPCPTNNKNLQKCFTIQQNLFLNVPGNANTPSYLIQNVFSGGLDSQNNVYLETQNCVIAPNSDGIWNHFITNPCPASNNFVKIDSSDTLNLTSVVSNGQFVSTTSINKNLENTFYFNGEVGGVPLPFPSLPSGTYINLDNVRCTTACNHSPQLDIIGPSEKSEGTSTQTTFGPNTQVTVSSQMKLDGAEWSSVSSLPLDSVPVSENSYHLKFTGYGTNIANFIGDSNSDDEGVAIEPINSTPTEATTTSIEQGSATILQVTTGINTKVSGSSASDGSSVTVTTSDLNGQPSGTVNLNIAQLGFYDVHISGISDGIATVCISNPNIILGNLMQYWYDGTWNTITNPMPTVSGDTICGDIPVSALTGTPIVIGSTLLAGKTNVISNLNSLTPSTQDDKKDLNEAIKQVKESTDASLWNSDGIHLDTKKGDQVFDHEKQAVQQLADIVKGNKENTDFNSLVKNDIAVLVNVDKALATTAIADANTTAIGLSGPHAKDVQNDVAQAQKETSQASDENSKGHFDAAIDHYKNAWKHAEDAIKDASSH